MTSGSLTLGLASHRPCLPPPAFGIWQGNVCYSYALANRWLAHAAARAETQARARQLWLLAASVMAACPDIAE